MRELPLGRNLASDPGESAQAPSKRFLRITPGAHWRTTAIMLLGATAFCHPVWGQEVLTQHNNIARTGANIHESVLRVANVNNRRFGKLWTLDVDGQVSAQPLYVSGLRIDTTNNPNVPLVKATLNAVVVATMHNSVYLFDADKRRMGPGGTILPLWKTWLGRPRPGGKDIDRWSTNDPEWGILSTPVIDNKKTVLYLVAWHDDGGEAHYHYRLHALRLEDGTHVMDPVSLTASMPHPRGESAPAVTLHPRLLKQRPGLLLSGGLLYIAFGGDGTLGLVFAYDAKTLQQRAVWVSTPGGQEGGIWQSGQGPAADLQGNVYVMTGNGSFNANRGGRNYGSSFVKLSLEKGQLTVKDYFTPCNVWFLSSSRGPELGSAGPLLIPDTDLIVGGGKEGHLYLLSSTRMGGHVASPWPWSRRCKNHNILQEFRATAGAIYGSPVFWKGPDASRVYVWSENDHLRAYIFRGHRFPEVDNPTVSTLRAPKGAPGGMLSLSSDGSKPGTGILWAVVPLDGDANKERGVRGVLLALDAQNVSKTLWTSEQSRGPDCLGLFAKFAPPTVAGGKVFVPTYGEAEIRRTYGELARPVQFPTHYYVAVYGLR